MKLSLKRTLAALFAGALLAAPIASPFQLAAHAVDFPYWKDYEDQVMTDEEIYEAQVQYAKENGTLMPPDWTDEDFNLPEWLRLRNEMEGGGSDAASAFEAAVASGSATASTSAALAYNAFKPSTKVPYATTKSQIKSYAAKSDKVIGWLHVPNTNINEPIVIDPDQPNAYYETRTWDGTNYPDNNWQNYRITATFADRRVKFGTNWRNTSRNIVLYGHNWTNLRNPLDIGNDPSHVMFGQLPSYTDMTFAKNNPYIYFSTAENEGVWKVFAAFYCEDSTSFPYNSPNPSAELLGTNVKEYKNRSIYDFSTDVNENDRMITLSTCTRVYGDHGSQRFVVMARLLREGESDADAVTVTVNADMKKPAL